MLTLLSCAMTALFTLLITSHFNRHERIEKLYDSILFPLYSVVREDIRQLQLDKDFSFDQNTLKSRKKESLSVIDKSRGKHSARLYDLCLTVDSSAAKFSEFCNYINKNYTRCLEILNYNLPYDFLDSEIKRYKIIFWVSLSVFIVCHLILMFFAKDCRPLQFVLAVPYLGSLTFAIMSGKPFI